MTRTSEEYRNFDRNSRLAYVKDAAGPGDDVMDGKSLSANDSAKSSWFSTDFATNSNPTTTG